MIASVDDILIPLLVSGLSPPITVMTLGARCLMPYPQPPLPCCGPGQTLVCGTTELSIIAVQGRTFLSSWVKYGTHNIHTRQDTGHQPSLTPHTDPEYSEYTGYLGRTPLVEIVHQIQNINDTSTFAYNCTPGHITTGHHL